MNCDEYLPLISGHLDGVNSEIEERRLQEHLNTCESCRSLLSEMERNDALLRNSAAAPPADLSERIMRQVRSEQPRPSARKTRWIPIAASGLAAAALLSLVVWGKLPFSGGFASKDSAAIEEVKTEYGTQSAATRTAAPESALTFGGFESEAPYDGFDDTANGFSLELPAYAAESAEDPGEKRHPARYTPSAPMLIVWGTDRVAALVTFEPDDLNESAPLTAKPAPSLFERFQAAVPLLRASEDLAPDDGFDVRVYTVPYQTMMAAFHECAGVYENAVYYPAAFTAPEECSVILIDVTDE